MSTMKKILLALMIALVPTFVFAVNEVTLNADVFFLINTTDTNAQVTVTGKNGGVFTSLTVDANFMDVSLDNGSSVTFTVPSGYYFNVAKQSGTNSYTLSPSCITNSVTMSATDTVILRLTVDTSAPSCATPPSGGGGGGGGGITPVTPTGSIVLNTNASTTTSPTVQVNLTWTNAIEVRLSEDNQFLTANWLPVSSVLTWTFSNTTPGTKALYAQFRSATSTSVVYSDTIILEEVLVPEEPVCVFDNTKLSYDLYIVNPDGTERHMGTNFTRITQITPTMKRIGFEDSGSDMDHNDIVMDVDTGTNGYIKVSSVAFDAGWHHKIRIILSYEGVPKKDLLLWSDSHDSVGQSKTVSLQESAGDLCVADIPFEKSNVEVPDFEIVETVPPASILPAGFKEKTGCTTLGQFISYLAPNQGASSEIRDLQDLLRCLGYFPTNQTSTAIYGSVTEFAVRQFQEYHKLPITGVVDDLTRAKLNEYAVSVTPVEPTQPVTPRIATLVELQSSGVELIKGSQDAVYFYSVDGKRHVFPHRKNYDSWYGSFAGVRLVTDELLAQIPLGKNVTYRPGVRLLKIESVPTVYAVEQPNILRPIDSEETARALYGANWALMVDDVSVAFWGDYVIGEEITSQSNYNPASQQNAVDSINKAFGLEAVSVFVENTGCTTVGRFISYMYPDSGASTEIRDLQELLKCLGYFPTDVDSSGLFGTVTQGALRSFQAYHALPQTGVVDDPTRAQLNVYAVAPATEVIPEQSQPEPTPEPTEPVDEEPASPFVENTNCSKQRTFTVYMELEAEGEEVRDLQLLLICLGYFPEGQSATAYYGPVTESAVIAFQEYHNINPLGVVGPATRTVLNTY